MPRSRSAPAALVAVALLAAGPLHAASDTNLRPDAPAQKKDEIRVPIPGWSPEVSSNGCHVRRSPDETTPDRKAGRLEVPFWGLVERATGRHAAKAGYAAPDVFARQIAPLDEDLRRLVLLAVLRNRFGRDGLHTFFFLDGGSVAPAIRQALEEAGLTREFELFSRAMELFGAPYPVDNKLRVEFFGYAKRGGELNAFDHALMAIGDAFGSRERYTDSIVDYVYRTPALFTRIEGLREKLGYNDRLRYLIEALDRKIAWRKPADDIARQLAALAKEERHLIALSMFNMEFENGGVHQFFYNSSGDIAPEVLAAMTELGLEPQAAIFKRALAMLGEPYIRDNGRRRDARFKGDWSDRDEKLSKLTDEFYAIGGGAKAVPIKGDIAFEGGPGLRDAMVRHARARNMLPC